MHGILKETLWQALHNPYTNRLTHLDADRRLRLEEKPLSHPAPGAVREAISLID